MNKRLKHPTTFFVFKGQVLAINHDYTKLCGDVPPVLKVELCPQYLRFKSLMDAAKDDLKSKSDGKYLFWGGCWERQTMTALEFMCCAMAINHE